MAIGLPVVTTDHSGISELVEHGVNGHFAPEKNVKGIVENVNSIDHDRNLVDTMRIKAREKISAEFNLLSCSKQLEEKLRAL